MRYVCAEMLKRLDFLKKKRVEKSVYREIYEMKEVVRLYND